MQLDGTFPGRDLDEILGNMEGVNDLDDKVEYIQQNFSMEEMKKLEDEGSELAEEAMIQTARENASEEQAEEFIRNGFNERWQENPQEGLATIEKAIERHPETPEQLEGVSWHTQKVEIFRNLLKEGHVRTAKEFSEVVEGVKVPSWEREGEDPEDLEAGEIAEEVYQELNENHYRGDAEYLEKMVEIAENFDIRDWSVSNRKQDVVEEYAEEGEYTEALRNADRFGVEQLGDKRDVQDIAEKGYNERMEEGEYIQAAKIAQEARRITEKDYKKENYLEKEREAAKEAFKQNVDEGDYFNAKSALSRFETEGVEEDMQTYLIKKLTNDEIDQDQYQELTEEIGYKPQEQGPEPAPEPEPEASQEEYEQEPVTEEENEGYLSKINPFS